MSLHVQPPPALHRLAQSRAGSLERGLKRAIAFLAGLTSLFAAMVPPVEEGCRYQAFLSNGLPFTPTHGELAVNSGVLLSELVLVGAAAALLWLLVDAALGRRSG